MSLTRRLVLIGLICGCLSPTLGEAQENAGSSRVIDDFDSLIDWASSPSDGVSLRISPDSGHLGRAMRLDFDFQGHGGYAVARKTVPLDLPDNYAFTFWIRGEAPVNNLEFKLVDATGDNVWWMNQRSLTFPRGWHKMTIRRRQISFAWGPLGGGEARHVAAIEFAITAGTGGKGSVWIDQFQLEPRLPEHPYVGTPSVTASTSAIGHDPGSIIDAEPLSSWRSRAGMASAWVTLDFGESREFGGITIDWEAGRAAGDYSVELSDDGLAWSSAYRARGTNGGRDYVSLPESEARYIRISLRRGARAGFGIRDVSVKPLEWAATRTAFLQSVADDAPRGRYPRSFTHQQSYWTIVGTGGDGHRGLLSQDGGFESRAGGFSVEPFVRTEGRTLGWADAVPSQSLAGGYLPIPSVMQAFDPLTLTTTAFAAGPRDGSYAYTRYRLANPGTRSRHAILYLAIRPLQVNPPWQFLGVTGGASRIDSISRRGSSLWVNGSRRIDVASAPFRFGAATFDQGDISEFLFENDFPRQSSARDPQGLASAAISFSLDLAAGAVRDVYLRFPLSDSAGAAAGVTSTAVLTRLTGTIRAWTAELGRVTVDLPSSGQRYEDALRSNLAYMLINRDGPAIEPGARSYRRTWIRDGAMIGDALLRMGQTEPVREFIEWFAPYQYESGKVPCCVDARGSDPVPEHDSHGELIYIIAEYYRATGDRAFLEKMWPHIVAAVGYIDSLRQSRRTPDFESGRNRRFYGLMPPSISHEGYSAKPVHSYWDDFFVLRGLTDAADLAALLGRDVARYARIRDEFRHDLHQSIRATIAADSLDYIPASADLGDYDPTSTSIGITPGGQGDSLPVDVLKATYQRYLREARARRDSTGWDAYTPYEFRNVGALVQLGFRAESWELLQILFAGHRPAGWNQWPEVVWRDSTAPKFLGDLPHTWVGSDYVRSLLDMVAYVRASDSAIVIGAGVPSSWVTESPGVSIRNLPIGRGTIDITMSGQSHHVTVELRGTLSVPPGGLLLYAPFDWKAGSVVVDGAAGVLDPNGGVIVNRLPAKVVFRKQ